MMKTLRYQVRFTTPAFLGNAAQSGQWRTPPFKALLRQWWRVVWAAEHGFRENIGAMRREEGLLFGNAWLDHKDEHGKSVADHSKSLVRIRLSRWDAGTLHSWQELEQRFQAGKHQVGAHAYLGYGPLDGREGTKLIRTPAINAGESAKLLIAMPDSAASDIHQALSLVSAYGTVGGRSRNGWGSVSLADMEKDPGVPDTTRPWRDALRLDWPHAIGRDSRGPLIWSTGTCEDWKAVLHDLARIKIDLRKKFPFKQGINTPQDRHWLSYPVTKQEVRSWGKDSRLPNSLRFKVRPDARDPGKLYGVIFHMPCLPPKNFNPDSDAIQKVWERVHAFLDDDGIQRIER